MTYNKKMKEWMTSGAYDEDIGAADARNSDVVQLRFGSITAKRQKLSDLRTKPLSVPNVQENA